LPSARRDEVSAQSQKLARAQRKLREAETKLKRAERSVLNWRRKVADLAYEKKCVTQDPLWSELEGSTIEMGSPRS
jgi:capsule polysaccharide export protein KpsE/RkpR